MHKIYIRIQLVQNKIRDEISIQVEFADPTVVRGIVTQGKNGCCDKWVKKYKVFYSADCKTWTASGGGAGQVSYTAVIKNLF